ncbi:DUF397 domain-containing protein [Embleya sp. NBC_00896]|uniref:DUF397 domain-containing protein n=1 Tax=Embleya sp. NBC_00896 TaxID=2975961 RepID=UPI00386633B0|nr:DUF397 domain-containing protein [Embleya sp. NBC_00896]
MTSTPGTTWFKSSYSNNSGGQCVEGAYFEGTSMAIRDSKDPARGAFHFAANTWETFIRSLKQV